MAKSILITGGARSGKSAVAEARTVSLGPEAIYIATAEAGDAEMRDRIDAHRARRGREWHTVEEPLELARALADSDTGPRLVDCLTLWLSNLMLAGRDWRREGEAIADLLPGLAHPVVFVTNEVGLGLVPETPLGREFRDAAGALNQIIANRADEVILVVAGQPLKVKPPHD